MEEAIQILTAQKIRELLTLCGIGDRSDEPIKQHILGISNFGEYSTTIRRIAGVLTRILVRETRLSAGIKDIPANELRGSYRALSFAEKRGRVDYAGMDGPSRKKRKRAKKGSNANKIPDERSYQKDSEAASSGQTEQSNTCAVATDKSLGSGEPKVGDTAAAAHGEAYPTSNSSALPEMDAGRHSALNSPSSAMEHVPCSDHQKEPNCPSLAAPGICPGSTFDINDNGCFTLLPSRLSSMPTLCIKLWADESNRLNCAIVFKRGIPYITNEDLAGEYYDDAAPIIEEQIYKAGVRLAAWINALAEERRSKTGFVVQGDRLDL
ncbi:hypothetical protein IFM51744_11166 [Aspergillus udagawae]|nr:hypothetical protein IFM51744_11166 [Aspergillus udagawae]